MMLNLQLILAVAAGGALGSVARYLVGVGSTRMFGATFPWGTLLINIAGSFLIGAFVELFALKWDLPQEWRVFLTVGICGGFTTFSTFSLDAYVLMERGEWWPAAAYVVGSVVLSIAALVAALHLIRASVQV
jgi:CrcB protein